MIKGVLFDMDGVLIDSEHLTAQAAIIYFAGKGFSVKHEDFIPFHGTGEKGFFCGVAAKHGIPYDNDTKAEKIYLEYAKLAKDNIGPLPGVEGFIELCKRRKMKLAVATSAMRFKLEINLKLLGFDNHIFDALVCGSDIKYNKPDPEIYITAARILSLKPEECIVIEDAPSGVKAAKTAGAKCLAVTTSVSHVELSEADWIVRDIRDCTVEIFQNSQLKQ
jgi:HAD superfamily hydrolase (TIGR01509 family)